ncbi:MPS1 [Cyberlindnera jadinii]|uniref:MPS1 protein n=1 Tax=Cyberlindnera jadinii (strain ATCC 18201 / CBS 1600 / BCRC 20928 / JCM 3617 / NBRC 0987 / NRRL Y-1542) TaxID=983966 RepID=A0A0H5BZQ0_CYBJN|nr:MPS1 [Cyberlindnera jadinii]
MISSHGRTASKARQRDDTPVFLDRSDSDDDDNNFKPPALSNYALALLKKENDGSDKENLHTTLTRQVPKRVNFRRSPEDNTRSKQHHGENQALRTNTLYTNQSEHDSVFTRETQMDYDIYGSFSTGHDKAQKTPLNRSSSSGLGSTSGSHSRLRSSTRRVRGFGGLGPPKRASSNVEDVLKSTSDAQTLEDGPMRDITISPGEHNGVTVGKPHITPEKRTPSKNPTINIDFEGMNPYQYSRKHNIPSLELPRLVKIYFEQQKHQAKEAMSLKSPIRLKEAMYSQIEEQLKCDTGTSGEIESKTDVPTLTLGSDKENIGIPQRPTTDLEQLRSNRQPLAVLTQANQKLQNSLKTPNHESYQEYHYKQTEPLKPSDEPKKSSKLLNINGKQYEKLELLGKGGSSKVFKVKSLSNKVYAVKKISFDDFDEVSIRGFKGEIDLLSKLRDQERVVRLVDYSLGQGSLYLVMECGEIDLCHVLAKRLDSPMDIEFVRYHASELLKCVKSVHDADIVHSDLKPANFLFVKGMMKIIDCGIANAVPEHTVNIYRESQIGTPNYMAPEALIDNNQHLADLSSHKSQWKVGKPSDIWSCGCIIYQMIYGRPPYGGYQGSQRLLAIMNPDIKISYPDKGLGGVKVPGTAIATMQACLMRDPAKRWTVQQLLEGPFLKPRVVSEQFVNDLVKNAITYGISKSSIDDEELKTLADDVWKRISQLSL